MDWYTEAKELREKGLSYDKIAKQLNMSRKTVQSRFIRDEARGITTEIKPDGNIRDNIYKELQKECTIGQLCDKYKQSERVVQAILEDIKEDGFLLSDIDGKIKICKNVLEQDNVLVNDWKGERIIRFGLCGDPQFNSKYVQITHLHKYYEMLASEGITTAYNTGDIDEGEEMRPGHKYECYKQGADDHVEEIVKNYPVLKNGETFFITGNHDHSLIKRAGLDIGKQIAEKRKDMKYVGMSNATIELTPNCTLELRHPIDGTAYAISYKMQKMIEAMSGGEKPNILAVGHYHKAEYLFYRNVHAIQTGCFQAQTSWMKGKQIAAMMGGWIIEAHVDEEGTITRFKQEFIPFYRAIKDDYLNWR